MYNDLESLKYPIGKFTVPQSVDQEVLKAAILSISQFPKNLFQVASPLTPGQLERPYRPGGWTVRQLLHHCADSHGQALFRFKHALTEENPSIKPYDEGSWAKLSDAALPTAYALDMIRVVHAKWVHMLQNMSPAEFSRTYYHPEKQRSQTLSEVTLMYAWHGEHHLAHISGFIGRNFDL
ncbi:MAG: putative metal-dependent hydrolase [Bacteroidetes bacterium]|nr:putative metal-dependent hydrolase [Bacteroidota bacterium]MDA1267621.1 putative metal-dependent hydrolase [Bacteroidota bacterium]